MNTKTKIMLLAGFLAVMLWDVPVFSAQDGPRHGMGPRRGGPGGAPDRMMMVLQRLDLTEQQRSEIRTILDGSRDETRTAREAVMKARQTLDAAVTGDANEAAIRNAANAVGKAIGDEAVLKAKTLANIKAKLTAEQLAKFKEIMAEKPGRPGRLPPEDPNGPPPPPPEDI